jgi:hypothetical protein
VLLEKPPYAVVADLGGGGMLDQEVLMDPLGRQPLLPLIEKPCEPRARNACLTPRRAGRRVKTSHLRAGRRARTGHARLEPGRVLTAIENGGSGRSKMVALGGVGLPDSVGVSWLVPVMRAD